MFLWGGYIFICYEDMWMNIYGTDLQNKILDARKKKKKISSEMLWLFWNRK